MELFRTCRMTRSVEEPPEPRLICAEVVSKDRQNRLRTVQGCVSREEVPRESNKETITAKRKAGQERSTPSRAFHHRDSGMPMPNVSLPEPCGDFLEGTEVCPNDRMSHQAIDILSRSGGSPTRNFVQGPRVTHSLWVHLKLTLDFGRRGRVLWTFEGCE